MKYILFIMFFVTPPNELPAAKRDTKLDNRIFALQSTQTLEFATDAWCRKVAHSIHQSLRVTATITVRMACIPHDEADLVVPTSKAQQRSEAERGLAGPGPSEPAKKTPVPLDSKSIDRAIQLGPLD